MRNCNRFTLKFRGIADDGQPLRRGLEPGDLQLVNHYVSVYSRTDFIDHEERANKRLVWR